ncbi:hypothetical protein Ddye_025697 [Dipteronia dyeriana]|uniref:MULE transposase domain-containing protein n=1 Tax=Dipteronia dyeriana TaxID=168575 RepID=A0AAD9TLC3_9ROSI|nr:hypothetical protein Ddye_025697 [Dipteronia dyeriana]
MNDSSDEDKDPTMVARYCHENQWTPNPNGSIDLKEGQIFGNAKMVKDVVKRKYANTIIAMNCNTKAKTVDRGRWMSLDLRVWGVMLSAIALDADSGIFPIAFCICEVENTDTWVWFLRHIIANFNATYKNINMTGKLWAASRSGDVVKFKALMESIREESDQAYNYLMKA